MFSFRSILLAAAAFATFTSAVPAPETGAMQTKRDIGSVGDVVNKASRDVGGYIGSLSLYFIYII